jgi:hypothetical protein
MMLRTNAICLTLGQFRSANSSAGSAPGPARNFSMRGDGENSQQQTRLNQAALLVALTIFRIIRAV